MPRTAFSDLKMDLIRTYEAAPADGNPNTLAVKPGDPGTFNLAEAVGQ